MDQNNNLARLVRAVNPSEQHLEYTHGGTRYAFPPGHEGVVPYAAMCLWAGDPDARDTDREKARTREVKRLRVKYGSYVQDAPELDEIQHLTFYPLGFGDADTAIETIVHNPSGTDAQVEMAKAQASQAEMIRRLEEQNAAQAAQLEALQKQQEAEAMVLESAADDSDSAPDALDTVLDQTEPEDPALDELPVPDKPSRKLRRNKE